MSRRSSEERMDKSPEYIGALQGTWKLIIMITFALGIILLVGGVIVALLGNQGETTMTLFGQDFTSTSVGVALAFLGVIMVIYTLRRLFKSIDHATTSNIGKRRK